MSKVIWVQESVVLAIHEESISEHGGGTGIRDRGLLKSALTRPQNLANYEKPDIAELAASYGFGIARNHPFIDGNKRTAFVVMELFLQLNGYTLNADDTACVLTSLKLAEGSITENKLAEWIRQNISL